MSNHDPAWSGVLDAYAGATSGQALDAAGLRSKILRGARAPRKRSLRRLSLALPLVATLLASAAFAASQPAVRALLTTHLQTLFSRSSAATPGLSHGAARHPVASSRPAEPALPSPAVRADEASPAPIAASDLPLLAPAPAKQRRTVEAVATRAPAAHAQTEAASPNADLELESYRAAHRSHFDSGNPALSLEAWNRYLEEFPAGRFASDARFNRALCLIRLGRHAEATVALEPFASAPPGSYRQSEAESLLQGLGAAGLRSIK